MSAFVALMLVELHFPDAGSLKGKRKELASAKAQLQGRLGVTVSEVEHQDLWQRSTLALAATAGSHHGAELAVDRVQRFLDPRFPRGFRMESTIASFQELL